MVDKCMNRNPSQIVPHHMWHIMQLLLHLNLHDASPLRSETDAVEGLHLIAAKALHEVQYILSGWYIGVLSHFGNLILTLSKSASESVFICAQSYPHVVALVNSVVCFAYL